MRKSEISWEPTKFYFVYILLNLLLKYKLSNITFYSLRTQLSVFKTHNSRYNIVYIFKVYFILSKLKYKTNLNKKIIKNKCLTYIKHELTLLKHV